MAPKWADITPSSAITDKVREKESLLAAKKMATNAGKALCGNATERAFLIQETITLIGVVLLFSRVIRFNFGTIHNGNNAQN